MGEVDNNGTRPANYAKSKRFKALMLWNPYAEIAHVQFDKQSMEFFHRLNYGDGFVLDTTTTLKTYTYEQLKEYSVIIALNESPSDYESRALFEKYMENGGGWIGFHASAYNDRNTRWPWYVKFLGLGSTAIFHRHLQLGDVFLERIKNLPDALIAGLGELLLAGLEHVIGIGLDLGCNLSDGLIELLLKCCHHFPVLFLECLK